MKKCIYCAEEIQDEAIVCRFCGRDIVPGATERRSAQQGPEFAASAGAPRLENRAAKVGAGVRRPKWMRIGIAVLLAGAIPIAFSVILLALISAIGLMSLSGGLKALISAIYLLLVFLFHLVPLPLGFWAGLAWPGTHLRGHAVLAVSAGVVEVVTGWTLVWTLSSYLGLSAGSLVTIDYMFALGTVSLFIAGGLFGDLFEMVLGWRRLMDLRNISQLWRRRALTYGYRPTNRDKVSAYPTEQVSDSATNAGADEQTEHTVTRHEAEHAEPTEQVSDSAANAATDGFSPKQVLLIQTMVPGTFALTGTIITAIATLLKASP